MDSIGSNSFQKHALFEQALFNLNKSENINKLSDINQKINNSINDDRFLAIKKYNETDGKSVIYEKINPDKITPENYNEMRKDLHLIIIKVGEQKGDPKKIEIRATHKENSQALLDHLAAGNTIAIEQDGQVTHHEMKNIQVSTFTESDLGMLSQALKQYFIMRESKKLNETNQIDKSSINEIPVIHKSDILNRKGDHPSSVPKNNPALIEAAVRSIAGRIAAKKMSEIRKEEKLQKEDDNKKDAINKQEERREIRHDDDVRIEIDKSFLDNPYTKKNPPTVN